MRILVCLVLLMPVPAFADTIFASSTITAVTVYPQGAHDVLITDFLTGLARELIRLGGSDGVILGAFSLRTGGLPAQP